MQIFLRNRSQKGYLLFHWHFPLAFSIAIFHCHFTCHISASARGASSCRDHLKHHELQGRERCMEEQQLKSFLRKLGVHVCRQQWKQSCREVLFQWIWKRWKMPASLCITLQPEETYINCWSEAPFCAWDKTYCVFYFNLHGMEITPYRIVPQDVYFSTSPTH